MRRECALALFGAVCAVSILVGHWAGGAGELWGLAVARVGCALSVPLVASAAWILWSRPAQMRIEPDQRRTSRVLFANAATPRWCSSTAVEIYGGQLDVPVHVVADRPNNGSVPPQHEPGLFVWEGRMVDGKPVGDYRRATPEEVKRYAAGLSVWGES